MIKYNVTLKTTTDLFKTTVEVEDRGEPVQNNGAAIEAATREAVAQFFTVERAERVERV